MNGKKIRLSLFSLLFAFLFLFTPVFAQSPQSKSVPVTLTVLRPVRMISVTVPASLPILVKGNKTYVAKDAEIRNNDKEATVYVSSLSVKSGSFTIGNYESFTGIRSVALKINGVGTRKDGNLAITSATFPDIGPQSALPLRYAAKVSPVGAMETSPIAEVVITLAIRSE